MNTVQLYEPSEKMWQALELKFKDDILERNDPIFREYLLTRKLTSDNVCSVLRTLLTIEDMSTMALYAELIQSNGEVGKTKSGKCRIKLPNNSRMLVTLVDSVVLLPVNTLPESHHPKCLFMPLPHNCKVGEITGVPKDFVVFESARHCTISPKELVNRKFDIMFRSPRIPYRLMYRALNVLATTQHARRYLFPPISNTNALKLKPENRLASFKLFNERIATNPEQLQAVQQIVAGPNPQSPYIVFGPPGSGKTTTIVETILQLYMQKGCHILVTAASNSACDTLALTIIECIEKNERFLKLPNGLHNVIMRLVSYTRLKKGAKSMHPSVLKFSNYSTMRKPRDQSGLRHVDVKDYGIVVATLCTASMRARHCPDKFTHIFIDEAASCSEPEILLAISDIKGVDCHVILSGDHKQLGPVVKHKRAAELGLDQSLMERLMRHSAYQVDADTGYYDRTLQTRLRRNYRAHPQIVGLYNELFYNNEIIPLAPLDQVNQAEKWSTLPNGKFPILFQETDGKTSSEANSTSSFNVVEAQVLCWYVKNLLESGLGGVRVQQNDIGVITPYLSQCLLLRHMLHRELELVNVDVGTVEGFQGREKPIVIASLVSSSRITDFLSNSRRVNVLISRARTLLILIGNAGVLSLRHNFKFIIDQCKLHKNVLHKNDKQLDMIIEDISKFKLSDDEDDDDADADARSSCSSTCG